ncbi:MAG: protein-glutamate methylesterase/protein-glutamine glutaminase [Chloroflexota bacterium]
MVEATGAGNSQPSRGAGIGRPIRVLVTDDSAFMRQRLRSLLDGDSAVEVVATARDGVDCLAKVREFRPDVVTMDIEMPRLDGLSTLGRLMAEQPVPVVMVSSFTKAGADATVRALALGAVDFVAKPSGSISLDIHKVGDELLVKVKQAAAARVGRKAPAARPHEAAGSSGQPSPGRARVVVVGSSTGGPRALYELIPRLPADLAAGVVIVQHMPAGFTHSLAQRLDEVSPLTVKEAQAGDRIRPGLALLAPGGYHLTVDKAGTVMLDRKPPVNGVRPAVDVTLTAVVGAFGGGCLAVILTGMGTDGSRGATLLRAANGAVIAEHESTCVVYGMPRAVVEAGHADAVLPLERIAAEIVRRTACT